MTVCLVMNALNEEDHVFEAIMSALPLIDTWLVCDTGSSDQTIALLETAKRTIKGEIVHESWDGFAANRTRALEHARDRADWLLWMDADMLADVHADLRGWLADDPDPDTDAWMVELQNHELVYRLPLLLRGGLDWRYVGAVHEYLDPDGRKFRPLLGLTITHVGEGRGETLEQDLELLRPGFEKGVPRDVFYTAECLRFLGRTDEAIAAYRYRDELNDFEEEAWFAAYQAARLSGDIDELVRVHRRRPWRHEPLTAAARIIAAKGAQDDVLFLEQAP